MFIRTGVLASYSYERYDLIQITKQLFNLKWSTMKEFRPARCMSILVEFRELLETMKLQTISKSIWYIITFKDSCCNAPSFRMKFANKHTHMLPQVFDRILCQ
jgi:hypothetical protein